MKLVVGLGNPGIEYANSRHNVGFDVVDHLVAGEICSPEISKKVEAILYKLPDAFILKPQTFMNLSGRSVKAALEFYKISPDNLLIVHDDVDLELGEVKHQFDRSSAGHNGVESIIQSLGTQGFHRLRLGVGRPENNSFDVQEWVLQKFVDEDKETAEKMVERAAEVVANWLKS